MWPLQIVFSLRLDSSIKNRIQGNGFDRNRLLHETEEELAATCRSPIVESEGELVRNAGNGNIPAITVGSGIPPRLHRLRNSLPAPPGLWGIPLPLPAYYMLGSPESGRYSSPSHPVSRSISLRRQTFPNKEIRIGLRRMVTRIHKAIKFTPAPNSPEGTHRASFQSRARPCSACCVSQRLQAAEGSARSSRERARDRGVSVESTATRRPRLEVEYP